MLPLVFSREQGTCDLVVAAVDDIYCNFADGRDSAQALIHLVHGATLGAPRAVAPVQRGSLGPPVPSTCSFMLSIAVSSTACFVASCPALDAAWKSLFCRSQSSMKVALALYKLRGDSGCIEPVQMRLPTQAVGPGRSHRVHCQLSIYQATPHQSLICHPFPTSCNASILPAGELGALEEILQRLLERGLLKPSALRALWLIAQQAAQASAEASRQPPGGSPTAERAEAAAMLRACLALISMTAAKKPEMVAERLDQLLRVRLLVIEA